jgi:hypothetical protein
MYVESNRHGRQRLQVVASLMFVFASLAGSARAVEFDEKLKAPMAKDVGTLKAQSESFGARFAQLHLAAPQEMVTNTSVAREQFDLRWQAQQSVDRRQSMEELAALGFKGLGDGGYTIDVNAFPQWNLPHEEAAAIFPTLDWNEAAPGFMRRGFREQDVATVKDYVATHDVLAAARQQSVAVSIAFSKVIKKIDRLKQPVPDSLVLSYVYQRQRAESESQRAWLAALLQKLDAQRVRIMMSTLDEMLPTTTWLPEDPAAVIADALATVRLPNFEEMAVAEAKGVAP